MRTSPRIVVLSVPLAFAFACRGLPVPEPEPKESAAGGHYLDRGPAVGTDLGPGTVSLLADLQKEKETRLKLAAELKKAKSKIAELEATLARLEHERDSEHAARVSAETRAAESARKVRDREARILNLSIEKARLEQEVLLLKIAAAEAELSERLARNRQENGSESR